MFAPPCQGGVGPAVRMGRRTKRQIDACGGVFRLHPISLRSLLLVGASPRQMTKRQIDARGGLFRLHPISLGKPSFGGRVASTNDQATDQRSQRGIPPPSNVLEKPPFSGHVASTSDQATDRRSVWDLPPKSNVLEKPPFGEHVASTMLQSKPRQHMTGRQKWTAFLDRLDGKERSEQ
jgi:hypothetical protein